MTIIKFSGLNVNGKMKRSTSELEMNADDKKKRGRSPFR